MDIQAEGPTANSTVQKLIKYAPWKASMEFQMPIRTIVFAALFASLSPTIRAMARRMLRLSRSFLRRIKKHGRKDGHDDERRMHFHNLQISWKSGPNERRNMVHL
ncbi:unnamed protein product [Gongylonema pulchrum]|uniref:Dimer_Tnp_hAT domain-containing protein n=1 Tax=Gongylonema pulchrum TaxID=637853 RepID=A0A183E955_9BILA|nr:unnamed protein product [Gongylonema pulchrum]